MKCPRKRVRGKTREEDNRFLIYRLQEFRVKKDLGEIRMVRWEGFKSMVHMYLPGV